MPILMEIYNTVANILTRLGLNETFFYQFGIFLVFFFISKPLFFDLLQFVLENRRAKTTELQDKAATLFSEGERLAKQYESQVQESHKEFQKKINLQKKKMKSEKSKEISIAERKAHQEFESNRQQIFKETEQLQKEIAGEREKLSSMLVNKLIAQKPSAMNPKSEQL